MVVRYLHWLGVMACIAIIVSCFLPWVYYADINQTFTGFYSYQNQYGRPGRLIVFLSALVLVFMLLPKVWAKRTNLFLCALLLAYVIKTYILFGSCYNNYCPDRLFGIYLLVSCTPVMLIAAAFPNLKISSKD